MAKYNTKLEDIFSMAPPELDNVSEMIEVISPVENNDKLSDEEILDKVDKISNALPEVKGLEASDLELDELAGYATQSYKDIQDLAFNSDPKHSAEILSVAATMLSHAISAKTNKINKKLKMIELQIKKQRNEMVEAKMNGSVLPGITTDVIEGKAVTIDRNELLLDILKLKKS